MGRAPRLAVDGRASDARALLALAVLTAAVAGNWLALDAWLGRLDVATQFLPWYAFLGERLRALDLPGWNPHLLSGAPFAGHPLSGWAYPPAMLAFTLLPPVAALKAMVAGQIAVAAAATYALGRVLGMGPAAALVAASAYVVGPFLEWNTHCCLQFAQFASWVPLALLGVELALRARRWRDRVVPWCVAAVAVALMLGGWVGEGWIYALLLVATYAGYRALLPAPGAGRDLRALLMVGAATGAASVTLGLALGAAGVLPRLAANGETTLAGGNYARLEGGGVLSQPWGADYLLAQLLGMGTGYHFRAAGLGGAIIVLALLAPPLAGRRFAVPFFAALTLVALVLTLDETPLHRLAYLIPGYRALHEHDPWRVVALAAIGPAVLAGAAVEALPAWRGRRRFLPVVAAPLLLVALGAAVLGPDEVVVRWPALAAAGAATLVVAAVVAVPWDAFRRPPLGRAANWAPVLLLAAVVAQPAGLELTGSLLGWPRDPRWEPRWRDGPAVGAALAVELATADPGGTGAYLRDRLAEAGPFRYVGYGGVWHPDPAAHRRNYAARWFEPAVQAMVVNGRPMFLGLYEVQGYDPIQLARYAELVEALNGRPQDYHFAYVLPSGTGSPLLRLLDPRYALVDASLSPDREDVAALTAGRREVFRTEHVAVYEADPAPPHAWIVHDVRPVARGAALPLLLGGEVDPYRTALVEGAPPVMGDPVEGTPDSARVVRYAPDALAVATVTSAPGMLILSEIYAEGWRAAVDGAPVPVLPTHHALRGVPVPAGEHTVELWYEPPGMRLGLAVSGMAAATVLAFVAGAGWRRVRLADYPSDPAFESHPERPIRRASQ